MLIVSDQGELDVVSKLKNMERALKDFRFHQSKGKAVLSCFSQIPEKHSAGGGGQWDVAVGIFISWVRLKITPL